MTKERLKVLIIDDEKDLCLLIKAYLSRKNCDVHTAYTLSEGLMQVDQFLPDILFLDNNLPDGLHGVGCNTYFYACNGGFSTRLTCPGNTFFDIQELQCNNREWIVACGGQKPTTLPP